MFGHKFYHGSIRRYIILFGTLFNDIYISRTDTDGNVNHQFRVPITYGPKEKVLARVNNDENLDRPWAAIMPFMSFKLVSFYYEGQRHLNKMGRLPGTRPVAGLNKNVVQNVYNPVPYTFNFQLEVNVKSAEDGTKIIEQIAPWFTPDWTTTIRIIDEPEILIDVPTILNPIESGDGWEGSFENNRYITYTLSFKMLGYLYGPSRKDKIIKVARTRVGVNEDNIDVEWQTTPGMTVDGVATSNSAETVAYSLIDWDDDYGFIEERVL